MAKLYIYEGIDGSGKTTLAAHNALMSTAEASVMKFASRDTVDIRLANGNQFILHSDDEKRAWIEARIQEWQSILDGTGLNGWQGDVHLDRSIISTVVFQLMDLEEFEFIDRSIGYIASKLDLTSKHFEEVILQVIWADVDVAKQRIQERARQNSDFTKNEAHQLRMLKVLDNTSFGHYDRLFTGIGIDTTTTIKAAPVSNKL